MFSLEHLAGVVKNSPAHQYLAFLGQRRPPRADVQLDDIKALGFDPDRVFFNDHFAQMDPDPFLQRLGLVLSKNPQPTLQSPREPHRIRGLNEGHQE
jgi:hypothetical protein